MCRRSYRERHRLRNIETLLSARHRRYTARVVRIGPWQHCASGKREEAVFSSSEDRTRASHASVTVAGPSIVSQDPDFQSPDLLTINFERPSPARSWATRAAESLFSVLFPADCRICGEPLLNISRLPVCIECLAHIHPVRGKICSICGERVLSSYADLDVEGLRICPACRRIERPFNRAVAYGSYESGLRELIHLLKYNGVRPAAAVLGRMLSEAIADLESTFEHPAMFDQPIALIPVPLYKT